MVVTLASVKYVKVGCCLIYLIYTCGFIIQLIFYYTIYAYVCILYFRMFV